MHTYLWLAKDASGKESAQRIKAESAQEARAKLESNGFTELRLVKDDIAAEVSSQFEDAPVLDAKAEAKMFRQGPRSFWRTIGLTIKDSAPVAAVVLVWSGIDYLRDRRVSPLALGIQIAIIVFFALWMFSIHLNTYLYAQLNHAREWRRAKTVLRLAGLLDWLGNLTKVKVPQEELARNRAAAYAWQGDLDRALKLFELFRPKFSNWLYAAHVSTLYSGAQDQACALEWAKRAVELNPEVSATQIDLAWKQLVYGNDLVAAKQTMAAVGRLEITDLAKPFIIRTNGVIAMREGNLEQAETLLKSAEKIWLETDVFFRYANLMITKAFLCQLYAKLGNRARAEKEFNTARPWLEQVKEREILKLCHDALAGVGSRIAATPA